MRITSEKELKPVFRALYDTASMMLGAGKEVNVEVTEFKNKRSTDQNAYYWNLNTWIAECLNDAGCIFCEYETVINGEEVILPLPYTAEIVHDLNKRIFGLKTTTKMDIHEFCDYTTKVTQFWQERTHGEFLPKELPVQYLIRKGYDLERNLR